MCTKQERIVRILESNKGLMCPFKPILCEEGYCRECQIYLDWLKLKNAKGIGRSSYGTAHESFRII